MRMASAPRIHDLQNLLKAKEAVAQIQSNIAPPMTPAQQNIVQRPNPQAAPPGAVRNYAAGIQTSQAPSAPPQQRPQANPATRPAPFVENRGNQAGPVLDFQKPTELWIGFVEKVKKSNGLLGAILENTELLSIDGSILNLGVPKKMSFLLDKLKEPDNLRRIEKFIETLWNKKFSIQAQHSGDAESATAPKVMEQKKLDAEEKSIEKQIENHPLVRSTQELFKAQIKSIKEKS